MKTPDLLAKPIHRSLSHPHSAPAGLPAICTVNSHTQSTKPPHCDTQPHTTHSATTASQQSKEINTQPLPIRPYDPSKPPSTNNQACNLPIIPSPPNPNKSNKYPNPKRNPIRKSQTTNNRSTITANTQIPATVIPKSQNPQT
jgi:hypothetical protein